MSVKDSEVRAVLIELKQKFGAIANELHNSGGMLQFACESLSAEMVEAWKPAQELLDKLNS